MLAVENMVSRGQEWRFVSTAARPGGKWRAGGRGRGGWARSAGDECSDAFGASGSGVILCALVSQHKSAAQAAWWNDKPFLALSQRDHGGDGGVFEMSLPADCRVCGVLVWQRSELHRRFIRGRPEPLVAFWLRASR